MSFTKLYTSKRLVHVVSVLILHIPRRKNVLKTLYVGVIQVDRCMYNIFSNSQLGFLRISTIVALGFLFFFFFTVLFWLLRQGVNLLCRLTLTW